MQKSASSESVSPAAGDSVRLLEPVNPWSEQGDHVKLMQLLGDLLKQLALANSGDVNLGPVHCPISADGWVAVSDALAVLNRFGDFFVEKARKRRCSPHVCVRLCSHTLLRCRGRRRWSSSWRPPSQWRCGGRRSRSRCARSQGSARCRDSCARPSPSIT
jgi:hypothetical protein